MNFDDQIKTIKVNPANLEHIASTGVINGSLQIEIRRLLQAAYNAGFEKPVVGKTIDQLEIHETIHVTMRTGPSCPKIEYWVTRVPGGFIYANSNPHQSHPFEIFVPGDYIIGKPVEPVEK